MLVLRDADVIVFQGMKRSGNHVVIDWITDNVRDVRHFNNVFPLAKELKSPGLYTFPVPLGDVLRRQRKWFAYFAKKPKHVLVSIEDFRFSRDFFSNTEAALNILLLRSAENVFSSRIHKSFKADMAAYPKEMNEVMRRAMDVWANHVASFIENNGKDDFEGVLFDDWITNADYRKALADRLGFEAVVPPRASRAWAGGGSSFDGHAAIAGSDPSSLLSRREQLSETERDLLEQVLADPPIAEAQRKLDQFLEAKGPLSS